MESYKILIKIRESRKKSREKRDTEQTNTINKEELKSIFLQLSQKIEKKRTP